VRGAIAAENGTAVLAVGAKPGVVFEPSRWESILAAFSYAKQGNVDKGRAIIGALVEHRPHEWQGHYNAACFEIRYGDTEAAIAALQQAHELAPDQVAEVAAKDPDLDPIRDDPRVAAISRKTGVRDAATSVAPSSRLQKTAGRTPR
jgi:tetratricopeptide (TPR) repeat protein